MSPHPPYTLEFLKEQGAPADVIMDMARFDHAAIVSATLVSGDVFTVGVDQQLPNEHRYREVTLRPKHASKTQPTLERWATFWLGTRLKEKT